MNLLALVALTVSQAADENFTWLAGHWIQCSSDNVVQESWIGPAQGMMAGVNLTHNRRATSFEFMRIVKGPSNSWHFIAQPGGSLPVSFKMTNYSGRGATFENSNNDFPTRVSYWREGARLRAKIEGVVKGTPKSQEWTFSSAKDASSGCRIGARTGR